MAEDYLRNPKRDASGRRQLPGVIPEEEIIRQTLGTPAAGQSTLDTVMGAPPIASRPSLDRSNPLAQILGGAQPTTIEPGFNPGPTPRQPTGGLKDTTKPAVGSPFDKAPVPNEGFRKQGPLNPDFKGFDSPAVGPIADPDAFGTANWPDAPKFPTPASTLASPDVKPTADPDIARLEKDTGSKFNPGSAMDKANLARLKAGKPTFDTKQYRQWKKTQGKTASPLAGWSR